ncbi:MAG: AEC family transporter [Candidatus Nomurabacteria bacterium]|jgi:predicted permease|nr:AEC family transporter [Candidatus Nomurabacteria bacterium]
MLIDLNIFYSSLIAVAIMIAAGFALGKAGWVDEHFNKKLINLLLMVAMPCALFSAFPEVFHIDALWLFLWGLGSGALIFLVMVVISQLLFRPRFSRKNYFEYQFAFVFNNAVFLGYPLVSAIFGADGLISYAGFVVIFNLMLFGYGIMLFEKKFDVKHIGRAFINPNIIAVLLGMLTFVFSLQLPAPLSASIGYIGGIMTPLSLICIGYMLSRAELGKVFRNRKIVLTCVAQLILGPLAAFGVMKLIGAPDSVLTIIVLIQALPTATTLGLFAEKYDRDTENASGLVVVSTILSALTLPAVALLIL